MDEGKIKKERERTWFFSSFRTNVCTNIVCLKKGFNHSCSYLSSLQLTHKSFNHCQRELSINLTSSELTLPLSLKEGTMTNFLNLYKLWTFIPMHNLGIRKAPTLIVRRGVRKRSINLATVSLIIIMLVLVQEDGMFARRYMEKREGGEG